MESLYTPTLGQMHFQGKHSIREILTHTATKQCIADESKMKYINFETAAACLPSWEVVHHSVRGDNSASPSSSNSSEDWKCTESPGRSSEVESPPVPASARRLYNLLKYPGASSSSSSSSSSSPSPYVDDIWDAQEDNRKRHHCDDGTTDVTIPKTLKIDQHALMKDNVLHSVLSGRYALTAYASVWNKNSDQQENSQSKEINHMDDTFAEAPLVPVRLAKKNVFPVSKQITDGIEQLVQFAEQTYEFKMMAQEDQLALLENCWSRLLMMWMGESNFHFAVTPVTGSQVASSSGDYKNAGAPTMRDVDLIQTFISRWHALDISAEEIAHLRKIVLFSSGSNVSIGNNQLDDICRQTQAKLQSLVLEKCGSWGAAEDMAHRYGQLLLLLPCLCNVPSMLIENLFCKHLAAGRKSITNILCDALRKCQDATDNIVDQASDVEKSKLREASSTYLKEKDKGALSDTGSHLYEEKSMKEYGPNERQLDEIKIRHMPAYDLKQGKRACSENSPNVRYMLHSSIVSSRSSRDPHVYGDSHQQNPELHVAHCSSKAVLVSRDELNCMPHDDGQHESLHNFQLLNSHRVHQQSCINVQGINERDLSQHQLLHKNSQEKHQTNVHETPIKTFRTLGVQGHSLYSYAPAEQHIEAQPQTLSVGIIHQLQRNSQESHPTKVQEATVNTFKQHGLNGQSLDSHAAPEQLSEAHTQTHMLTSGHIHQLQKNSREMHPIIVQETCIKTFKHHGVLGHSLHSYAASEQPIEAQPQTHSLSPHHKHQLQNNNHENNPTKVQEMPIKALKLNELHRQPVHACSTAEPPIDAQPHTHSLSPGHIHQLQKNSHANNPTKVHETPGKMFTQHELHGHSLDAYTGHPTEARPQTHDLSSGPVHHFVGNRRMEGTKSALVYDEGLTKNPKHAIIREDKVSSTATMGGSLQNCHNSSLVVAQGQSSGAYVVQQVPFVFPIEVISKFRKTVLTRNIHHETNSTNGTIDNNTYAESKRCIKTDASLKKSDVMCTDSTDILDWHSVYKTYLKSRVR